MSDHIDEVRIIDNPDRNRFEIHADGKLAGWAEYRLQPGRVTFTHTEMVEGFQGRGLAGRLARSGLDTARERDLRVIPLCPYIASYIRKHPEYVPLVDEQHREHVTPPEKE